MKNKKTVFFIIIAVLAVVAIAIYVTTRMNRPTKDLSSISATQSTDKKYSIGESYDNHGLIVTVDKCEKCDDKEKYPEVAAGNDLIRVHISMKNTTKESVPVAKYAFKCYADSHTLTEKDLYAEDKLTEGDSLSPNRIEDGYLYYEVPKGAKLELEYFPNVVTIFGHSVIYNLTY